jgi:hypothetical protein
VGKGGVAVSWLKGDMFFSLKKSPTVCVKFSLLNFISSSSRNSPENGGKILCSRGLADCDGKYPISLFPEPKQFKADIMTP